jgi:hypothetical protein
LKATKDRSRIRSKIQQTSCPPPAPPHTWRPRDYGRSAISISGKPKFSLAHKIFILQGGEHLLGSKNNYLCSYVVQECHSGFLASFCQNFSEQAFRLDPSRDFWRQERRAKKIFMFSTKGRVATVARRNITKSQCCGSGSGSTGSTCFWASRIRIHQTEVWIRWILLSTSKKS